MARSVRPTVGHRGITDVQRRHRRVLPLVHEHAGAGARGRLPDEVVEALAATGLNRLLLPEELGGLDAPVEDVLGVVERLAAADGTPDARPPAPPGAHPGAGRLRRPAACRSSCEAAGPATPWGRRMPVLQMRLVVEADDFAAALAFYRDALGLREQEAYEGDGGARVVILDAGRATLELVSPAQHRMIDEVEVGRPAAPDPRGVRGRRLAPGDLHAGGGGRLAGGRPVETPWRSLNSRLDAPAGLQITLFQELD